MPIPMTIEMKTTENSERCPMTRVATPIDQHRLSVRMASSMIGLPMRRKAISSSPRVRPKAR